jgi:adenosylhomocysteine nucleosidase
MNDQVRNPSEPAGDAEHEPCHVGFVFALSQEAGGLIDRLSGAVGIAGAEFIIQEGGLAGRRVAVIVSGPGRKAARRAAEVLIAGHAPQCVVSTGFAGGLVEAVKRGELVLANELVDAAGARIAVEFSSELRTAAGDGAPAVHVGRAVTVDEIVTTPEAKRALGEQHQAIAVDMESLAVAEVCAREGVGFAAIRIVSDAVGDALPAEVSNLIKQKSLAGRLGAVAGAMFNRPSSIKDIYKLKEDALIASDRLAKFLESIVPRLADAA